MTITDLAARNRANRMEQLARLAPLRREAKAKAETLHKARQSSQDARGAFELMKSLSHVPNFFPTPKRLVERMLEEAGIEPGMSVLEPSAGKGDIAKAIQGATVQCIEISHTLVKHLSERGFNVMHADFLEVHPDPRNRLKFDRVLMNPPFERGIDEDHILHAFKLLSTGGRLVAIACQTTGRKLEQWAADHGGFVEQLPQGTFASGERPTQVNTCLIVANN